MYCVWIITLAIPIYYSDIILESVLTLRLRIVEYNASYSIYVY